MDIVFDPKPGAQSPAWLNDAQVVVPGRLLAETIEVLERVGCQFIYCDGPTLDLQDMITCYACEALAKLRVAAGLPAHSEDDGTARDTPTVTTAGAGGAS